MYIKLTVLFPLPKILFSENDQLFSETEKTVQIYLKSSRDVKRSSAVYLDLVKQELISNSFLVFIANFPFYCIFSISFYFLYFWIDHFFHTVNLG